MRASGARRSGIEAQPSARHAGPTHGEHDTGSRALRPTIHRAEEQNASGSQFSLAALYVNPYSARWWFGEWLMRRALSSLSQARSADEALLGRQFAVGWEDAP